MRGVRGGAWHRAGHPDDEGETQEVAGDVARLRHAGHAAALGEGEEDDRGASGLGCCWAGHLGRHVAAQVSTGRFSISFFFSIFLTFVLI